MPNVHPDLVKAARPFFAGERETFATVLLGCMMTIHGAAVLNWDPVVIEAQVKDDFGVLMPEVVYDQLMALINVLSTDSVYTSVPVFDQTVNALTRCGVGHEGDIPTPEEVAWTVFEIMANDPDPFEMGEAAPEWPFSADIARYVGAVLADDGLKRKPDTLDFAAIPNWAPRGLGEDQATFAGALQMQEDAAGEVDTFVTKKFHQLVADLHACGIRPAPMLLEQADDLPEESPLDQMLPG